MDMTPPDQMPPQDAAAPPAEGEAQGYAITVMVMPDGTFSVNDEPLQDIGGVLKKVMSIVQNNGQTDDGDAQFDEGFGKAPEAEPAMQTDPTLRA